MLISVPICDMDTYNFIEMEKWIWRCPVPVSIPQFQIKQGYLSNSVGAGALQHDIQCKSILHDL